MGTAEDLQSGPILVIGTIGAFGTMQVQKNFKKKLKFQFMLVKQRTIRDIDGGA